MKVKCPICRSEKTIVISNESPKCDFCMCDMIPMYKKSNNCIQSDAKGPHR